MKKLLFAILIVVAGYGCSKVDSAPGDTLNPMGFAWDAPLTNVDESPITDGAGYRIYLSNTSGGPYILEKDVFGWAIKEYNLERRLPDGQYSAVLTAYDTAGNESAYSAEVTFVIDYTKPSAPTMRIK